MSFIKLTNTYGLDLFIQPDDVKAVAPESGSGSWTQVYLYGAADHRIWVKESPQEVLDLVNKELTADTTTTTSFHGRN